MRTLYKNKSLILFHKISWGLILISRKFNWYNKLKFKPQILFSTYCVKSVQIRSFSWSECGKIRTRKNSVFGHFSHSDFFPYNWKTRVLPELVILIYLFNCQKYQGNSNWKNAQRNNWQNLCASAEISCSGLGY